MSQIKDLQQSRVQHSISLLDKMKKQKVADGSTLSECPFVQDFCASRKDYVQRLRSLPDPFATKFIAERLKELLEIETTK